MDEITLNFKFQVQSFKLKHYAHAQVIFESSIETMLGFNEEKGMGDLGLKQNCIVATSTWRCDTCFYVKTCCNFDLMMFV